MPPSYASGTSVVSDRIVAALVAAVDRQTTEVGALKAAVADLAAQATRGRDADLAQTGEIRKLTEAVDELVIRVGPLAEADDRRGRALGKLVDRWSRLKLVEALGMVLAATALPMLVLGLVLALRHPLEMAQVVVALVTVIAGRDSTPPAISGGS